MNPLGWNPSQELAEMSDRLNRVFARVPRGGNGNETMTVAELARQIKELLDTRIRPVVAQDGGDIVFHSFEDGVVFLSMRGACAGCPSSTATLKSGIENLLKHFVPEVNEVRAVN